LKWTKGSALGLFFRLDELVGFVRVGRLEAHAFAGGFSRSRSFLCGVRDSSA